MGGTSTVDGLSRIQQGYAASDQRVYLASCADCGEEHELVWENVTWSEGADVMHEVYGRAQRESARYTCPHCGSQWGEPMYLQKTRPKPGFVLRVVSSGNLLHDLAHATGAQIVDLSDLFLGGALDDRSLDLEIAKALIGRLVTCIANRVHHTDLPLHALQLPFEFFDAIFVFFRFIGHDKILVEGC